MTGAAESLRLGEEYPAPGEERMIAEIVERFHEFIIGTYGHVTPHGNQPKAHRDAHPKAHGCVTAEFAVEDALPLNLQHGVLVPGAKYPALIRFSSADPHPNRSDRHTDVRGMAIKLLGVDGPKLLPDERDERTQDFLLINSSVFFSPDVEDYRDFTKDLVIANAGPVREFLGFVKYTFKLRGRGLFYLPKKIRYSYLLERIKSVGMDNPLTSSYWSAVPYKLGPSQAVKYAAQSTNLSPSVPHKSPDFLREAMSDYLEDREAIFNFMVQVQTDAETMPVEDATIEWDQRESPFVKVATIRIPRQHFECEARMRFAENLSYTPWHSLDAHRPLGGINRMRKTVYESGSKLRHDMNSVPRREPTSLEDVPGC
jgi:hypothetical protein